MDSFFLLHKILNKFSHVLRSPIHLLNDSADDLPFTIDEKSVRAIPDSISIGDCGIIINEDGGGYLEFIFIFYNILLFLFGRNFERDQICVLKLLMKFSKRRRLPLAVWSPRGEKV